MIVKLNGKEINTKEKITLEKLLEELEIKPDGIAIAIDSEVIPKQKWKDTTLTEEIDIMLIRAVSGG